MYIRGTALEETITLDFTVSGQRREGWKVTVTFGGATAENETLEHGPWVLLSEMLAAGFKNASRRRFPERATLAASEARR
jgi:hypothetical protein